jgi:hypothetical protein
VWQATLGICRWGPGLLASYGGVLADRYQRVTVLVVSDLASAALMTGMAVMVAGGALVVLVLALSALSAAALVPYRHAAGALTLVCSLEVAGPRDPAWPSLALAARKIT